MVVQIVINMHNKIILTTLTSILFFCSTNISLSSDIDINKDFKDTIQVGSFKKVQGETTIRLRTDVSNFGETRYLDLSIKTLHDQEVEYDNINTIFKILDINIEDNWGTSNKKEYKKKLVGSETSATIDKIGNITNMVSSLRDLNISRQISNSAVIIARYREEIQEKSFNVGDFFIDFNLPEISEYFQTEYTIPYTVSGVGEYQNHSVLVSEGSGKLKVKGNIFDFKGIIYVDIDSGIILYSKIILNGDNVSRLYPETVDIVIALSTSTRIISIEGNRPSKLKQIERKCSDIGFTKGTEKFGDCVMKLYD